MTRRRLKRASTQAICELDGALVLGAPNPVSIGSRAGIDRALRSSFTLASFS